MWKKVVINRAVLDGQQDKVDWCTGVFDGGGRTVEFMSEKSMKLLNQFRLYHNGLDGHSNILRDACQFIGD